MKSTKLCAFSLSLLFSAAMATAADTAGNFFDENGAYYGPDCEKDGSQFNGAYYTGNYESPFKTYLGKTDAEIKEKMDAMWEHYFKGDNNSKVFFDNGNEGYIKDINNNDVRSEGMSYGMMIAVQTGHKEEFDKLWKWAKNHMWHKGGDWDGYFAWQRGDNGMGGDDNCAPDGEMYFMMSLLFAANRWDDDQYRKDALYIMDKMWNNPSHKLFNQGNYIIVFQPLGNGNDFSDPSYDLPAYLELFSRWAEKDTDKWKKAVTAARDHLYKSSNTSSGLFADYSSFNGQPQSYSYNSNSTKYMYDAMRCAMNFGMDYYLFGADSTREIEMANRIINFFEKDGYKHARFNWDGSNPQEQYTQGEAGANAVAAIALRSTADSEEKIKKNLQNAWDTKFMTGQYRYYDGLVHYLAMLHLSGNFKIWKPKPTVEEKSVEASEYCGVKIEKDTTFYAFESCKLYKVSAKPETIAIGSKIKLNNAVRVWSTNSAIVIENAVVGTKFAVTDLNGRVLKSAKTSSAMQEVRINSRGNFLVIVGDKTYKVVK
ncbi:glycosyl hydrolase family 8 [Fibrobacter sp. UWB13]|uniref:glycosyl hydrolase family 8 n=1 Tax=Fibrobacter sp. UWB13 TaxID=1896204 RepID=UPI000A0E4122|nr:glycosyl hydrolase family 8 [Fibrobacter sp. UWB13]SMG13706.1 Endo-1,4-beta-D-glucanase Y [Fibrobacter sp. UWB13]